MGKEKLGQEPAFPFVEEQIGQYGDKYEVVTVGMSKRFYAACAAMQGLLTRPMGLSTIKGIVAQSYEFADELLKQEND